MEKVLWGMEGFWKEKNYEVKIVNMYSSCERGSRLRGWEELKLKRASSGIKSWCLLGDFNSIKKANDREGVGGIEYGRRE